MMRGLHKLQPNWELVNTESNIEPRSASAMVFDKLRNRLVMWGGYLQAFLCTQQICIFDFSTGNWSFPCQSGDVPHARCWHSMVLLSDGNTVLLFGGVDYVPHGEAILASDVYLLDLITFGWQLVKTSADANCDIGHRWSSVITCVVPEVGGPEWVIVHGGYSHAHIHTELCMLNTSTWHWSAETSCFANNESPGPLSDHTICPLPSIGTGHRFLLCGGRNNIQSETVVAPIMCILNVGGAVFSQRHKSSSSCRGLDL